MGRLAVEYLDVWLQAGIPAGDILKAMTTSAAKLLKIDGERGVIAPGRYADLIAVPANPLEDVRSLRRVSFVMRNGEVVRQ